MNLFATCPRGLEALLAEELKACGAADIEVTGGGAKFAGDWRCCYRVNLESRVATRVLMSVAEAPYRNEQDVYDLAYQVDWPRFFPVSLSLRVDLNASRSPLRSLDFATLRIKDAVCDRFREAVGSRPDVDTKTPGVRVAGFLDDKQFSLYLDTSGEPLHKRGYGRHGGEAPLKENLAAGIVMLSGWKADAAFLDPMCGSGTLLIEAAFIALDRAPGLARSFGFERLKNFDAALWQRLLDEARARVRTSSPVKIYGADLYGDTLKLTRTNLEAAGVADFVELKQANVLELPAPAPEGVMVVNPPYGKRLGDNETLESFYPKFGDALKARFAGWRCYLFSADLTLTKHLGLKASKRTPLFNGGLECRLFEYKIIAGSMRKQRD